MDWLDDFIAQFSVWAFAKNFKEKKFHGSVEITFADGIPVNFDFRIRKREVKK